MLLFLLAYLAVRKRIARLVEGFIDIVSELLACLAQFFRNFLPFFWALPATLPMASDSRSIKSSIPSPMLLSPSFIFSSDVFFLYVVVSVV